MNLAEELAVEVSWGDSVTQMRWYRIRIFFFYFLVGIGFLPLTGCLHYRMHTPARPAEPLAQSISEQFGLRVRQIETLREHVLETNRHYLLRRMEIGSTNESEARTITVDFYQAPRRSPVILILPISGGDYEAESIFARYFARRGLAVVLVRRREIYTTDPTPSAINAWLKESISDNKRVLDWIETQPELDPQRIGLFGISLGAIQGALLAPLDARIQAAALGLAGSDLPYILSNSTEKGIVRDRNKFLKAHEMDVTRFHDDLARTIDWDPAKVARYAEPEKVLLILGRFDTVVPFRKGCELRRQMGFPETIILPTGHYSSVLCIFYVERVCYEFLEEHLRPGIERVSELEN